MRITILILGALVVSTQALAVQPFPPSVDPELQNIVHQGMCCRNNDPRVGKAFDLLEGKIVEARMSIGDGADLTRPCLAQAMRELDGSEALIAHAEKVSGDNRMAVMEAGWGIAGAQSLIEHDRTNTCKRRK